MHLIQRHILRKLVLGKNLRYKDLRPKEIESNQFMYHLKTTIDQGYVIKRGIYYSLTTAGKMYADRASLETLLPREQPKIVTMIYCENKKGEVLLYRRSRSPVSNLLHIPYGKLHMGETLQEAAHRELKEKMGLSGTLTHAGDIYVRVYEGDELLTHILHHIFIGKNTQGELHADPLRGSKEVFWAKMENVPKEEIIGGLPEIIDIIKKNPRKNFFEEFDLRTSAQ